MRALAVVAALLLAGTARAQAPAAAEEKPAPKKPSGFTLQYGDMSATLYGLLDLTLVTKDNATTATSSGRLTGMPTPWFSGSRWGIEGRDALSPDLGVIFKLESEYVIGTGEQDTAGVLFNRDAWVGVDGTLGKLTFGRQNTLARDFAQNYGDAYGSAETKLAEGGWTNTNNFKQLIYFAGSVTSTRMDRGIVWKKNFGPIVAGLGYQFAESAPGGLATNGASFAQNTTRSAGIAYNGGIFNVSGYYTWAGLPTTSGAGILGVNSWSIGGNVTPIPLLRVNAGYFRYTAEQNAGLSDRTDQGFTVSTKVMPPGAFDFELGWVMLKTDGAGVTGTAADPGNLSNPFKGIAAPTVQVSGTRSTYYGSVFYHLDRRAEVYLAADYVKLEDGYRYGGLANSSGPADSQTELAAGIRFKF